MRPISIYLSAASTLASDQKIITTILEQILEPFRDDDREITFSCPWWEQVLAESNLEHERPVSDQKDFYCCVAEHNLECIRCSSMLIAISYRGVFSKGTWLEVGFAIANEIPTVVIEVGHTLDESEPSDIPCKPFVYESCVLYGECPTLTDIAPILERILEKTAFSQHRERHLKLV